MNSLSLKLYPDQFGVLMLFLRKNAEGVADLPLKLRYLNQQVLADYYARWPPIRQIPWRNRPAGRAYALRLPIVVVLALYSQLQHTLLSSMERLLLGVLDRAIVDYQLPPTFDAC